jgi:hypothetical protein
MAEIKENIMFLQVPHKHPSKTLVSLLNCLLLEQYS